MFNVRLPAEMFLKIYREIFHVTKAKSKQKKIKLQKINIEF